MPKPRPLSRDNTATPSGPIISIQAGEFRCSRFRPAIAANNRQMTANTDQNRFGIKSVVLNWRLRLAC